MAKQILYNEDARKKIHEGAKKLSRAVRSTLGPSGHAVLIRKSFGGPQITNDGVTVSKEIELADRFENMGAKLVNEVCSKTNDVAGDGTTTACVLAEAILDEGMKVVAAGVNPIELRRGIEKATQAAIKAIRDMSREVKSHEEVEQVGMISAKYDTTIGKIFADALQKVGKDGVITIEEGKSTETVLEHVQGYQFDKGYISPYFITNPTTMAVEMEDAHILLLNKKVSNLREFLPLLDKVARAGASLLVVAEDIEGEALTTLVINKLNGILRICAVKAPGFGDRRKAMLEDMAILTGGTAITEESGVKLENLELDALGKAKKLRVDKDTTTIIEGAGSKADIDARIKALRAQIEKTTSNYDREKLEERLAKLTGGVAVVRVGANTETEMKELKMRVDDALHATKAAVQEGIVAGGGVPYLRAIDAVKKVDLHGDEEHARRIILAALRRPLTQIAANAGFDGDVVVEDVIAKGGVIGFDARQGEYVDMFQAGIIDPTKTVCAALENAVSVAALVLTSNTIVTDIADDEKAPIAGAVR